MKKEWQDPQKRERWRQFIISLQPTSDPKSVGLMEQMRLVSHALYQIGESSVTAVGLSYAKYRLLLGLLYAEEVEDRSELNPSEISQRQGTSRNTISSLIRDLEDDGLIARHLDQNDRRKFNICLTEKGRDLVRQHASQHMQTISACFHTLTPTEQETLSQLLTKVGEQAGQYFT